MKAKVRYCWGGQQKAERSSFSPATVISSARQLWGRSRHYVAGGIRGAAGKGAHPSPALAWALLSWALLSWARDAQSLLSRGVSLLRHIWETHLSSKRQLSSTKGSRSSLAGATEAGFIPSVGFSVSHVPWEYGTMGWRGPGQSSLEAELVWVADDGMGVHREGVEHHRRVDEVLLDALEAGIQLLKPHHLRSACGIRRHC